MCLAAAVVRHSEHVSLDVKSSGAASLVRQSETMTSVCCGVFDAASSMGDAASPSLALCLAASEEECVGEGREVQDPAMCEEVSAPCKMAEPEVDEQIERGPTDAGAEVEGEDEDLEFGAPCENEGKECSPGMVCSRGKCKYAAMEKCESVMFGASKCASSPYGRGHKFQCKTHKITGDKRCCIPSQYRHWGDAGVAMREHRPLHVTQYMAAHPGRTETADGKIKLDGVGTVVKEPQPRLVGYKVRGRGFRRRIEGGHLTTEPDANFYMMACCEGAIEYGHEGVTSNNDSPENKKWYCRSR